MYFECRSCKWWSHRLISYCIFQLQWKLRVCIIIIIIIITIIIINIIITRSFLGFCVLKTFVSGCAVFAKNFEAIMQVARPVV